MKARFQSLLRRDVKAEKQAVSSAELLTLCAEVKADSFI